MSSGMKWYVVVQIRSGTYQFNDLKWYIVVRRLEVVRTSSGMKWYVVVQIRSGTY